jgi:SAM-dependent methyltransferase
MAFNWGSLRNVNPVSRDFGYDRGTPIDRHYIESFLQANSRLICGRVLEIGDDSYTRQFGGAGVTVRDVLHVHERNPAATIIGDLADGRTIPSDAFDCAIITQTLHLIYDITAAVRTLHRILRPGGTALVTVPGVSPIARDEWAGTWFWCLTRHSIHRLFDEHFGAENVDLQVSGNPLAGVCFLQGIAVEDVGMGLLASRSPEQDVLFAVRAMKAIR